MTDYKNKVLFLRKSKKGNHLYAFDKDGALATAGSIIMNITDVKKLLDDSYEFIKVSVMPPKEE